MTIVFNLNSSNSGKIIISRNTEGDVIPVIQNLRQYVILNDYEPLINSFGITDYVDSTFNRIIVRLFEKGIIVYQKELESLFEFLKDDALTSYGLYCCMFIKEEMRQSGEITVGVRHVSDRSLLMGFDYSILDGKLHAHYNTRFGLNSLRGK